MITLLRRIPTAGGDVRHAIKSTDPGFTGFGEAYFSSVERGAVKGWKRHRRMTLNLVAACGEVRVLVHDEEAVTPQHFCLTPDRPDSYARLTVKPGLWVAFGGIGPQLNLLLNVADILHDPDEADVRPLDTWPWTWDGADP